MQKSTDFFLQTESVPSLRFLQKVYPSLRFLQKEIYKFLSAEIAERCALSADFCRKKSADFYRKVYLSLQKEIYKFLSAEICREVHTFCRNLQKVYPLCINLQISTEIAERGTLSAEIYRKCTPLCINLQKSQRGAHFLQISTERSL